MKKYFVLLIIYFFSTNVAFAKIHKFSNCWYSHIESFKGGLDRWSSHIFNINLQKTEIYHQKIHTDSILKEWEAFRQKQIKRNPNFIPTPAEKYQIQIYRILNVNNGIIRAKLIESSGVVFPDESLIFNFYDGTFEFKDSKNADNSVRLTRGTCDVKPIQGNSNNSDSKSKQGNSNNSNSKSLLKKLLKK
ncbi:hypothetical protein OAM08_00235 [Pelagibacteraceae bacterium]|nr:hypothetical protein [Pelagibacteraceae bacterium]